MKVKSPPSPPLLPGRGEVVDSINKCITTNLLVNCLLGLKPYKGNECFYEKNEMSICFITECTKQSDAEALPTFRQSTRNACNSDRPFYAAPIHETDT